MSLSREEIGVMELALMLHMPVYKLLGEMPYDEFTAWFEYMNIRPPGWKEDRRAFLLLSVHNPKLKPEDLFPTLAHIKEVGENEKDVSVKGLRGSKMEQFLLRAVGGQRLER